MFFFEPPALLRLTAWTAAWVLAALPGAGPAWAAPEVVNRVTVTHGPLSIDRSKNIAQITAAQAQGGRRAEYGLGLFQNRIKAELSVDAASGAGLALTTRLTTTPIIYIAKEFPDNSCAYRVVLEHELRHQYFDLEVLRALPDELRAEARTVFRPGMSAADLERAKGVFFQRFNFLYEARGFPLHASIDNPDSYRQLSTLCDGQVAALALGGKKK